NIAWPVLLLLHTSTSDDNIFLSIHRLKEWMLIPDKKESSLSQESASILSAYEWIRKYYHHLLKYAAEGEQAKLYLEERGLSSSAIDDFGLGYAPLNSDVTVDFLKQKGFHTQTLVKAGLISTHDNQHFRDV